MLKLKRLLLLEELQKEGLPKTVPAAIHKIGSNSALDFLTEKLPKATAKV